VSLHTLYSNVCSVSALSRLKRQESVASLEHHSFTSASFPWPQHTRILRSRRYGYSRYVGGLLHYMAHYWKYVCPTMITHSCISRYVHHLCILQNEKEAGNEIFPLTEISQEYWINIHYMKTGFDSSTANLLLPESCITQIVYNKWWCRWHTAELE